MSSKFFASGSQVCEKITKNSRNCSTLYIVQWVYNLTELVFHKAALWCIIHLEEQFTSACPCLCPRTTTSPCLWTTKSMKISRTLHSANSLLCLITWSDSAFCKQSVMSDHVKLPPARVQFNLSLTYVALMPIWITPEFVYSILLNTYHNNNEKLCTIFTNRS